MSRQLQDAVYRFLAAELGGAPGAQAEAALQRMLQLLPEPPVPAGFAAGVCRQLGLAVTPLERAFGLWSVRVAVTAALVAACLTLGLVPLLAGLLLPTFEVHSLVVGAVGVGSLALEWLVDGLGLWRWLAAIGQVLGSAATTPEGLALLLGSTLVAGVACTLLFYLTAHDRSLHHAMSARA